MEDTVRLVEELRVATREAHEVLKDLKRARRELVELVETKATDVFNGVVRAEVQELTTAIKKATNEATAKVFKRFDKITALITGDDLKEPSLEEILRVREWQAAQGTDEDGGKARVERDRRG